MVVHRCLPIYNMSEFDQPYSDLIFGLQDFDDKINCLKEWSTKDLQQIQRLQEEDAFDTVKHSTAT